MPNRILKETICTSDQIETLTPEQEVFFYRLMVVCDDYGLMDARPAILKARCYPLKSIDFNCIQMMLDALQVCGLINQYQIEGRPYFHITGWEKHQSIRAKRSKYPIPQASDFICLQMHADAPVIQSNPIQSESNPIKDEAAAKQPRIKFDPLKVEIPACIEMHAWIEWIGYRRNRKLTCSELTIKKQLENLSDWHMQGHDTNQIIMDSISNGWQGLFKPKTNGGNYAERRDATIAAFTGEGRPREPALQGFCERVDGSG